MFAEKDIPEEFKRQLYECCKLFADFQVRTVILFQFPKKGNSLPLVHNNWF